MTSDKGSKAESCLAKKCTCPSFYTKKNFPSVAPIEFLKKKGDGFSLISVSM